MNERLARQSFLGDQSDLVLDQLVVGLVGLGGAGSHIVQQLSHVGVGHLLLIDPDRAECTNLNRLVGATAQDVRRKRLKTAIAARIAKSVNPCIRLTIHSESWQKAMTDLRDADVIVGCLDSYSERSQLESFARRYLIPYIDIGMDVHRVDDHYVLSGQVARSMPGDVCLQCMAIITPDDVAKEAYGVAGGRPQVVWSNGILASAAGGLLIEMVTPWFNSDRHSEFLSYNGNSQSLTRHPWMQAASRRRTCPHYPLHEVGDLHPFWIASGEVLVQSRFAFFLEACFRKVRALRTWLRRTPLRALRAFM